MKNTTVSINPTSSSIAINKQRTYGEIIQFLDTHWNINTTDFEHQAITAIDKALGYPSKKIKGVAISGSNGKSITLDFTAKILAHEELKVGAFYAPHILTYNERFAINNDLISNKLFAEIANHILNITEAENINAGTRDILAGMALLYFHTNEVDVALFEYETNSFSQPLDLIQPLVVGITRIVNDHGDASQSISNEQIYSMLSMVKKNTHVVSADQSKNTLQIMQGVATGFGGIWSMPVRKISTLAYPFEQLHGRCAALAERIAQLFINFFAPETLNKEVSLLSKKKGQRGRPTLEAKKISEINPKKTIEQFWNDAKCSLIGRFQILDKEKPTVLLDNASNIDSFKNLLLGIRLLHYHRALKGLVIIVGFVKENVNMVEFTKIIRYFFKKNSGQIIFVPINKMPGEEDTAEANGINIEKLTNNAKSMKIKARSAGSFAQAFDLASKAVDERNGLVVVTGSSSIISEYWIYKGLKKW